MTNESLVEKFDFFFLTPLSHNLKMLHFDANPITIGYPVSGYRVMKNLTMLKKPNIKQSLQRNLNTVFANISKTILPTSDSFL